MDKPYINQYNKKVVLPQVKFWAVIIALMVLPTIKSTIYNASHLASNIMTNAKLKREKANLAQDKIALQNKLKEYKSRKGLKRAIREEIKLVEKNEILIKIVES